LLERGITGLLEGIDDGSEAIVGRGLIGRGVEATNKFSIPGRSQTCREPYTNGGCSA